ncbi:death-associated inhibitor of apoptosis 2 [Drosophila tropicalis]|uniref:death-associated inhibitor of apoptosis 2 n=1 Tax=Drosophila tropicalis TaxID=46794 RepID=UPI0035ABC60B
MTDRHMELESERLATFTEWPSNAPVTVRDLVASGFFATGNWLEVECNWCHVRIDQWEYGDQVATRHGIVSPICSMVLAPNHCGNVPIARNGQRSDTEGNSIVDGGGNTQQQEQILDPPDLLVEKNRLDTFTNWPNPNITPQSLARAGFYYLNHLDHVKCVWCRGVISMWEKNDNAFDEHRRLFPDCPRVQMGPLIEFAAGKDLNELGIQPRSRPQRPKYDTLEARLKTFDNWPIANIQAPEGLAQAGLFYQNIDDQVRCFHCDIGLRSWEKEDEPWHEHAKWSPKCQFLLLAKGPNFVHEVINPPAVSQMDTLMVANPAKEAVALGIDGGVVRNAIQRRVCNSGSPFDTLEDLLQAIFDEAGGNGTALEVTEPLAQALQPSATPEPSAPMLVADSIPVPTTSKAAAQQQSIKKEKKEPTEQLATTNGNSLSLEEENRQLKDARLCKVCLDNEVAVVFLPCGHLVTCNQCARVVECPLCRTPIKGYVRAFLP